MGAKEDAARYWAWKDALYASAKLDALPNRFKAIVIAEAMTMHTGYGQHCYRSDGAIAKIAGVDRHTVSRYRRALTQLGFFTETGQRKGETGHIAELAIAIPADAVKANGPDCYVCESPMVRVDDPDLGPVWTCPKGHAIRPVEV